MKSGKNAVYYHYNGHNDVVALTDDNGQQVASYTYDAEIQQYYLMARYYYPAHGVFTSLDPDPGDEDDPLTMNGYTYTDNNPVLNVDLMGIGFGLRLVLGLWLMIHIRLIKKQNHRRKLAGQRRKVQRYLWPLVVRSLFGLLIERADRF